MVRPQRILCFGITLMLLVMCAAIAFAQKAVDTPKAVPALESTREESLEAQLLMAKISSERNRLDSLNAQIELAKQQAVKIQEGIKQMESEFPAKMNAIKKRLGIKDTEFEKYDSKLKDDGSVIVFTPKPAKKD